MTETIETQKELLNRLVDWAADVIEGCFFVTDVAVERHPDYLSIVITTAQEDINDSDMTLLLNMFPSEMGGREYMRHEHSLEISYGYEGM